MTPQPRPQECLIRVGITKNVSGDHLITSDHPYPGSTEFRCRLERALPDLAEGGYVVDLRPLADHPLIDTWVWKAPMCNGKIEGEEINRLSESSRQTAQQLLPGMEGDFLTAAS